MNKKILLLIPLLAVGLISQTANAGSRSVQIAYYDGHHDYSNDSQHKGRSSKHKYKRKTHENSHHRKYKKAQRHESARYIDRPYRKLQRRHFYNNWGYYGHPKHQYRYRSQYKHHQHNRYCRHGY